MLMASILLVAFAARALIPPGFMPATDRPFSIEICWDDFPARMLARGQSTDVDSMQGHSMPQDSMGMEGKSSPADSAAQHHSGHFSHTEHCVFGTACGAGPVPHMPVPSGISLIAQAARTVPVVSDFNSVRLVHLPQARAPPASLLS